MDDKAARKIRAMERVAEAVRTALEAGANAYANGEGGEKPTVDRHFTAGNQQRYGWQPLSRDYYLRKQRSLKGKVKSGVFFPGGGKTGSRLDKAAEFQSGTGELVGIGSGTNKPMLVNSGDLRSAVVGPRHQIIVTSNGDRVTIRFSDLPKYAIFNHTGDGVPQRSPVQPNELDRQEVIGVIRRHIDAALGTGGQVPRGAALPGSGARMA